MFKEYPATRFAPPERAAQSALEKDAAYFRKNVALNKISDAVSTMLVILNKERQIVFANKLFFQSFCKSEIDSLIGKRPGEAINCIYAYKTESGCGTTEFCRNCGGVGAILESQLGKKSENECRIITNNNNALDLRIIATPYRKKGTEYTIFAIHDISHEKRRQALENVFFHDVLNSAGGILGLSDILSEIENRGEIIDITQTINRAAKNMVNEINAQRQLSAAEKGDLVPTLQPVNSIEILNDVMELYSGYEIFKNKNIEIGKDSENIQLISDPVILRRILGNLVKNALEASHPGSTVKLWCSFNHPSVRFSVHNNGYIERKIQQQIFQRSFSTKGTGRGIGTYSMKLLGEKYLKGKVGFESNPEKGTIFYFDILNSIH
jgi:K+-sensing histidine kinase KdpD